MLDYIRFISLRLIKRKSNLYLMVLMLLIICALHIMNNQNQNMFYQILCDEMKTSEDMKDKYNAEVKNNPSNKHLQQTLLHLDEELKIYQDTLSAYNDNDWNTVYDNYIDLLETRLDVAEISQLDDEAKVATKKSLEYFKYLNKNKLVYENLEYPIYGVSFTTFIARLVLPILVIIYLSYVGSQIVTFDMYKHLDISVLLPMGKMKRTLSKCILLTGLSIMVYLGLILFSFIFSSLMTLNLGLDYPIMIKNGNWMVISSLKLFPSWFGLGLLSVINLALFTYLLSRVIKDAGLLMVCIIGIVFCFMYLPSMLGLLNPFLHFVPTTYFKFVEVVTNGLGNKNISIQTGYIVLSMSMLIQAILITMNTKISR